MGVFLLRRDAFAPPIKLGFGVTAKVSRISKIIDALRKASTAR